MKEIWRELKEYKDYEVSNMGRIRRISTSYHNIYKAKRLLKEYINEKGYRKVALFIDGKVRHKYVHVLVALAFIPNPLNLPEVNHIKTLKNCRPSNLEWRSKKGNILHAVQNHPKDTGIDFNKARGKWRARLGNKMLGRFCTKKEALIARQKAVYALEEVL